MRLPSALNAEYLNLKYTCTMFSPVNYVSLQSNKFVQCGVQKNLHAALPHRMQQTTDENIPYQLQNLASTVQRIYIPYCSEWISGTDFENTDAVKDCLKEMAFCIYGLLTLGFCTVGFRLLKAVKRMRIKLITKYAYMQCII